MCIESIRKCSINKSLEDKLIWHFDKTDNYTVKSGYKVFLNSKIDGIASSSNSMEKVWNSLWKLKIPSKIKLFCWKALNNTLPTKLNLLKRGIASDLYCPICGNEVESTDHILFQCCRAKEIWEITFNRVFLETNFNGSFVDRWLKIVESCSSSELGLVAVTCWSIWNDRNKTCHEESIPSISIRSQWIIEFLRKYLEANLNPAVKGPRNRVSKQHATLDVWSPPPDGFWKFNVDAAWLHLVQRQALASLEGNRMAILE